MIEPANHIFAPNISKAKEMIDEGVSGSTLLIRSREAHFELTRLKSGILTSPEKAS